MELNTLKKELSKALLELDECNRYNESMILLRNIALLQGGKFEQIQLLVDAQHIVIETILNRKISKGTSVSI